jgi:hypothetical protein
MLASGAFSFDMNVGMTVRAFHPILYVADPYAERAFFARFGFETEFEDEAAPGFLAIRCGSVVFGLSGNRSLESCDSYEGVRWQLLVDDLDAIVAACDAGALEYERVEEVVGEHRPRAVVVVSPGGVPVWFEGSG